MAKSLADSVFMLGLDGSGKRSLLQKWADAGKIRARPSKLGVGVHLFRGGDSLFVLRCLGCKDAKRLVRGLFAGIGTIVFVVNAAETRQDNICKTKELIHDVASQSTVANSRVVVVANKQDFHGACPGPELFTKLELARLTQRLYIVESSAETGFGLDHLFSIVAPKAMDRRARQGTSNPRSPGDEVEERMRRFCREAASSTPQTSAEARTKSRPKQSHGAQVQEPRQRWQKAVRLLGAVRFVSEQALRERVGISHAQVGGHTRGDVVTESKAPPKLSKRWQKAVRMINAIRKGRDLGILDNIEIAVRDSIKRASHLAQEVELKCERARIRVEKAWKV
mmetsp:Transcript_39933/g.109891  ORF Transcript_39933/g.109891 Transcript_39933/m.109891 type:complete len:338 (+) Transcript_39933:68-1081(+)